MHRHLFLVLALAVSTSGAALAQTPYAGLQTRPIKALSDQQVADLKAGRGMGLALAAELNGYPGPSHLLELAVQLGLSDPQKTRIQGLFEAMKAEIPVAFTPQAAGNSRRDRRGNRRDRRHASEAARRPSEISSVDRRAAAAGAAPALCRAARLCRRWRAASSPALKG